MEKNDFDITILGGGPGGYTAAIEAERMGLKVLLVDNNKIGGTCLHNGCIPTKSLLKSAELYCEIKNSLNKSITSEDLNFDFDTIIENSKKNVKRLSSGVEHLISSKEIEYVNGFGFFKDKHTLIVSEKNSKIEIKSDKFIIATGSKPYHPSKFKPDNINIYDSDGILSIKKCPESILIIGGGYIGIEFAYFFNSYGSKVTIVENQKSILGNLDSDLLVDFKKNFKRQGIKILENANIKEIYENDSNLRVEIKCDEDIIDSNFENILVATGRIPNTKDINLEKIGVILDDRGFIKINEKYQSNIDNIYAIGDVTGGKMLAHRASDDGMKIINSIYKNEIFSISYIPSCIYCQPEIASVGLTEEEIMSSGIEYNKSISNFKGNGKSIAQGEVRGFCKIMVDKNLQILGAHIIGKGATEMISELNLVMSNNLTINEIIKTIHPHPTLSEIIFECCLNLIGRTRHG